VLEDAGPQTVAGWATSIDDMDPGINQGLVFNVTVAGALTFATTPAVNPASGTLTYETAPNANGSATVTVALRDDGGTTGGGVDTSAPVAFTITATPVNDTPDFSLGANQTVESDDGAQSLPGFASNVTNGGPDEATQVLSFATTNDANALFATQPSIDSSGTLSYAPASGANGTATVSVTLGDDLGATSAPRTFTITVVPPSDPPPTVMSIARLDANPATSSPVRFSVVFSEPVTGVDSVDLALRATGTVAGHSISSLACINATCTVTVAIGSGAGTLALDVVDNDSIRDGAAQPLGGAGAGNGNFTGPAYDVLLGPLDTTPPVVSSIVRANASPSPGPTVSFVVTFSESVTGVGTSDFQLTLTGSLATPAIAAVSGSGSVYSVSVSTGTGVGTIRLDVIDDDTIVDVAANALGGAGTGNGAFTTGEVYQIDTVNPILIFGDSFENQ